MNYKPFLSLHQLEFLFKIIYQNCILEVPLNLEDVLSIYVEDTLLKISYYKLFCKKDY